MPAPLSVRLALALAAALPAARAASPAAGEYFFNTDPGLGSATPLPFADPPPSLDTLNALDLPLPSAPGAQVTLGLRFRTADGAWGPTVLRRLHLIKPAAAPALETAWGGDFSSASIGTPDADGTLVLVRPANAANAPQANRLSLRVLSGSERPGPRSFRQILPFSSFGPDRLHYALDQRPDPATAQSIGLDETHRSAPRSVALDLGPASPGYHTLHLRLRDASGAWTEAQRFLHVTPSGLQTITGLAYSFRDAEGASTAIAVAPLVATTAAQDVTLAVPVGTTPGETTLVLNLADSASNLGFTAENTLTLRMLFQSWAATALVGLPAEQSGMLADPDGDNLANLLEYAFGLDPRVADTTPPYSIEVDPQIRDILVVRYPEREGGTGARGIDYAAGGLRYTVEVSTDLQTWKPCDQVAGIPPSITVSSQGNGFENVTATLWAGGALFTQGRFFARLNITALP